MKNLIKFVIIILLMNLTTLSIWSIDANIKINSAKIITNSEYYYSTNDNGANWQKVFTNPKLNVPCCRFISDVNYYYITNDNGVNWRKVFNKSTFENNINMLKLYPNPTNGNFSIELQNSINENAMIYFKDISGKTCHKDDYRIVDGMISINLTTINWSTGIYNLEVHTDQEIFRSQIIIVK